MTYEYLYHGHGWGASSQDHAFGILSHTGQNYWMLIGWDRTFFLNHDTFGNQEGMITWYWLAEHTYIKLVSHFKLLQMDFKKEFQKW